MEDNLLYDLTERLVRDTFDRETVRAGSSGQWLADAWRVLDEAGVPLALVPEDKGGFGIATAAAADVLRLVGYWAIPLPLSEAMLASGLLARAGIDIPAGVTTLAPPRRTETRIVRAGSGWKVAGHATRVPWARHATTVVMLAEGEEGTHVVALPIDACQVIESDNLAGEPRDDVTFDCAIGTACAAAAPALDGLLVHAAGAALRTVMIAGAANRVLDMSVAYACEHKQFGRAIAAFQAVQQNLAVIGGQAAVCRGSADMAAQGLLSPRGILAIAIAKARVGEAASDAAHLGHQIHGAIGFTADYDLQLYTKRIWAWREEFGNETEWNEVVGQAALDEGAGPWALITGKTGAM